MIDMRRVEHPMFSQVAHEGAPSSPRMMTFGACSIEHARTCNRLWHSRLPRTNVGPWQFAFSASFNGVTYAVALWHNPSGRCLPHHWLELRRLAVSSDAPRNTASWFLAKMTTFFATEFPEREKCISYQDTSVHVGTIYKAANWNAAYTSTRRSRDRTAVRKGTARLYRWDDNGRDVEDSVKVRWEFDLVARRVVR